MAFHIKNPDTDALARRVAKLKGVGLTEAVHEALRNELARQRAQPSKAELAVAFCRALRARGEPERGQPANKAFFDDLNGDI